MIFVRMQRERFYIKDVFSDFSKDDTAGII